LNKTAEELKQLAQIAKEMCFAQKGKRKEDIEEQQKERKAAARKRELEEVADEAKALRLHKKVYKSFLTAKRPKSKTVNRPHEQKLLQKLDDNFPNKTGKEKTHEIDANVKEISKLRFHKAVFEKGKEPSVGLNMKSTRNTKPNLYSRPKVNEQFHGMIKNPKPNKAMRYFPEKSLLTGCAIPLIPFS
jgi:hypothetical protein